MIQIKSFFLGPMDNIVYLIWDSKTGQCSIIDPAWDPLTLIQFIRSSQLQLSHVLLTHGHHDHVNGLSAILDYQSVPVYLSANEAAHLVPHCNTLVSIQNEAEILLGNLRITAYSTPGHTPGGMCFNSDHHLFTGDTLFVNGCGRCDLESSDVNQMYDSLQWVQALPDNMVIYPGHHYGESPTDTLENQKKTNRFLTCETRDTFIRKRMGR